MPLCVTCSQFSSSSFLEICPFISHYSLFSCPDFPTCFSSEIVTKTWNVSRAYLFPFLLKQIVIAIFTTPKIIFDLETRFKEIDGKKMKLKYDLKQQKYWSKTAIFRSHHPDTDGFTKKEAIREPSWHTSCHPYLTPRSLSLAPWGHPCNYYCTQHSQSSRKNENLGHTGSASRHSSCHMMTMMPTSSLIYWLLLVKDLLLLLLLQIHPGLAWSVFRRIGE